MAIERVVIIPNFDNDGKSLNREQTFIEDTLLSIVGGFTVEDVRGAWRDEQGRTFYDASKRYTVLVSKVQDAELVRRLPIWCMNTRQKCLFTSARTVKVSFVEPVAAIAQGA